MYSVSFSPEAVNNLDNLYEYLSNKASPAIADRYIVLGIFYGGQNWESKLERAIYGDDDLK